MMHEPWVLAAAGVAGTMARSWVTTDQVTLSAKSFRYAGVGLVLGVLWPWLPLPAWLKALHQLPLTPQAAIVGVIAYAAADVIEQRVIGWIRQALQAIPLPKPPAP